MKDYSDICLIYKLKFDTIDKEKFRKAVEKTFKKVLFNFMTDGKLNSNI